MDKATKKIETHMDPNRNYKFMVLGLGLGPGPELEPGVSFGAPFLCDLFPPALDLNLIQIKLWTSNTNPT